MIYNIRKIFATLSLMIVGSLLVYNCEPEVDSLGEQLFLDELAQGNEKPFDLIAYNINNLDSIQSDASKLKYAVLGAFNETKFGKQKASYLTQVRLSSYAPDFGKNAEVDSVVLVVKPTYASDSVTTTNNDYLYPDTAGNIEAKKVVNTYPINKYGQTKKEMNLKVHEVTEFLKGNSDKASSKKEYTYDDTELGSKVLNGTVNSVAITKKSDDTSLFATSAAGIRVQLDPKFFQNKIINKQGQTELSDASNFTRFFKGLRISVNDEDGYLMNFAPNDMELIMYYKNDKTENGTTTRPQTTFKFDLGSNNTHIGNYIYNRTGTPYEAAMASINETTGDTRLYTQGMGGASIGIKFSKSTIDSLKEEYKSKKAAIISAKIRIYTDKDNWTSKYYKPTEFNILQKEKVGDKISSAFTSDLTTLGGASNFLLYRAYKLDENPTYYEFTVTQSLKNIVETTEDVDYSNKFFRIDLGSFLQTTERVLLGQQYTSRAYDRSRVLFIGSDVSNANRIKLRVTYGTK